MLAWCGSDIENSRPISVSIFFNEGLFAALGVAWFFANRFFVILRVAGLSIANILCIFEIKDYFCPIVNTLERIFDIIADIVDKIVFLGDTLLV